MKGFSRSVPTVTLNSGVHSSIRYRYVSLFISYNDGMITTSLDFRVSGVVVEIDAIS